MRAGLKRNQQTLWFSNPVGNPTPVVDEWGNETGAFQQSFQQPVETKMNVSAGVGDVAAEAFGGFTDYSRTVSYGGQSPMQVSAKVWFGVSPTATESGGYSGHNYTVTRVAQSLNGALIALKEVPAGAP